MTDRIDKFGLQVARPLHDFIEAEPDGQGGFAVNLDSLRSQASDEPAPPPVPDAEDEPLDVATSSGEIRSSRQEAAEPEPVATEPAAKPAAKPQAQQQAADLDGLNLE